MPDHKGRIEAASVCPGGNTSASVVGENLPNSRYVSVGGMLIARVFGGRAPCGRSRIQARQPRLNAHIVGYQRALPLEWTRYENVGRTELLAKQIRTLGKGGRYPIDDPGLIA